MRPHVFNLGRLSARSVLDARGRRIFEDDENEGVVFFFDLVPTANFAHPCAYLLVPNDGAPLYRLADFPPAEELRTERMA